MKKLMILEILVGPLLVGCAAHKAIPSSGIAPIQIIQQQNLVTKLSPDGREVTFVRSTPELLAETAMDKDEATEIWTASPDGGNAKMRLRGRSGTIPQDTLAGFSDLQFSPDSRRVFFLSAAWATSRAVHVLDLCSDTEKYVCPGNSLEVIPRGKYAGYLMVSQHRYAMGGGSYDWLWLISPDGVEVGLISMEDDETTENFRKIYIESTAAEPSPAADCLQR